MDNRTSKLKVHTSTPTQTLALHFRDKQVITEKLTKSTRWNKGTTHQPVTQVMTIMGHTTVVQAERGKETEHRCEWHK